MHDKTTEFLHLNEEPVQALHHSSILQALRRGSGSVLPLVSGCLGYNRNTNDRGLDCSQRIFLLTLAPPS